MWYCGAFGLRILQDPGIQCTRLLNVDTLARLDRSVILEGAHRRAETLCVYTLTELKEAVFDQVALPQPPSGQSQFIRWAARLLRRFGIIPHRHALAAPP